MAPSEYLQQQPRRAHGARVPPVAGAEGVPGGGAGEVGLVGGRQRRGSSALLLAVLCVAFEVFAAEQGPAFRVINSGYYVDRFPLTVFGWADSNRFVFKGVRPGERNDTELRSPIVKVWDTAASAIAPYKNVRRACFKDGQIRYPEYGNEPEKSGRYIWWEGLLEEETRVELEYRSRTKEDESRFAIQARNPFHCRTVFRDELVPPVQDRNRVVVALREGDGYVDVGTREIRKQKEELLSGTKLRWYHPRAVNGVELPMPLADDFSLYPPRYSALTREYTLVPAAHGAKTQDGGTQLIYYELDPTRLASERRTVPNFAPDGGFTQGRVARVKDGVVFSGSGTPWPKWAGIYVYAAGKVTRIERGSIFALSVAPDGCKVAYAIQTKNTEMGTPIEVKYADTCAR